MKLLERVEYILSMENVEYSKDVVVQLIMKYFPDFRRLLNELQRYSVSGSIDSGILATTNLNVTELVGFLSGKEFTNVRKWVVDNLDNESDAVYRSIYDSLYDNLEPASIPEAVVIIADYQYKSAFVSDIEINLLAALTEIMLRCSFK
jgi:replication factor C small subunit